MISFGVNKPDLQQESYSGRWQSSMDWVKIGGDISDLFESVNPNKDFLSYISKKPLSTVQFQISTSDLHSRSISLLLLSVDVEEYPASNPT